MRKLKKLSFATATVATLATVKPSKHSHIKICTTALLVSSLATCNASPAYAESHKVYIRFNVKYGEVLVRFYDTAIAKNYKHSNNHSFNYVDTVALSVNNGRQESQNLLNTVQHHTIVDVFLCLPFIGLPIMGELRLAIAFIALWWGGDRNKPFIRRILSAVCLRFLTLPAALHLGQIIKTSLPVRKV